MSHTEGAATTSYTWDVAAGLPVVIQDDDNTYVYSLDLISATDGAGVQDYDLYDGGASDGSAVEFRIVGVIPNPYSTPGWGDEILR